MSAQPKKRQPHVAVDIALTFAATAFLLSTFTGFLNAFAP